MRQSLLGRALTETDDFLVTVELLTSPSDGIDSYRQFFKAFRQLEGCPRIVAVTSPHSPGGMSTLDPFTVWSRAQAELPEGLDAIAHVTCKDLNRNGIETHLRNLRSVGVRNLLALTGDFPVDSKPVFELESLGLLRLIMEMNGQGIASAGPDVLDDTFQFTVGAGVNPFKYSLGSAWQQYTKAVKKIASGASFLIAQVGYDIVKSGELPQYLCAHEIMTPVFGNVYLLTRRATERMHAGELPGCYASDDLLSRIQEEWKSPAKGHEAALERMAQQTALFRRQGYRGVHIGGWGLTFNDVSHVLQRAEEIHSEGFYYSSALEICHFPPPHAQYYIGSDGEFILPEEPPKPKRAQKTLEFVHRHLTVDDAFAGKVTEDIGKKDGEREGFRARALHSVERLSKGILVNCRDCGDCFLPENFYALCNEASCVKGLTNMPCGDSDALTGNCGNDDETVCAGEVVFYAAFAQGKLAELAQKINPPKLPGLRGTSAVLNYFAGLDHRGRIAGKVKKPKTLPLIVIGECVHAAIRRVYWAMDEVMKDRNRGAKGMNGALAYLTDLITSQILTSPDYIAVNVDAFSKEVRPDLMRFYVDLVNSLSDGIPVCVDSSDSATKIAGVDQYFRTAKDPLTLPMVNSINMLDPKPIMELHVTYPFKIVAMLHERIDAHGNPSTAETVEEIHALAGEMVDMLMQAGFQRENIFLDTAVIPIATDVEAKKTHSTMKGIRAIMSDPELSGVHTLSGLSNCSHMMPNRMAINRAYLHVLMEHGLDSAVLDPRVNYGEKEPGKQILSLIRALADSDGSDMMAAMELFEKVADYSRKYGKRKQQKDDDE